jgi:ferredoxin
VVSLSAKGLYSRLIVTDERIAMAEFRYRYAENVPGKYYTDIRCLDCDFCREIAPTVFRRDDVHDSSYVFQQPSTAAEIALVEQCVARCPCEAIGADGDEYDWNAVMPDADAPEAREKRDPEKPKWKFFF